MSLWSLIQQILKVIESPPGTIVVLIQVQCSVEGVFCLVVPFQFSVQQSA